MFSDAEYTSKWYVGSMMLVICHHLISTNYYT
jgi:hypothetical protein